MNPKQINKNSQASNDYVAKSQNYQDSYQSGKSMNQSQNSQVQQTKQIENPNKVVNPTSDADETKKISIQQQKQNEISKTEKIGQQNNNKYGQADSQVYQSKTVSQLQQQQQQSQYQQQLQPQPYQKQSLFHLPEKQQQQSQSKSQSQSQQQQQQYQEHKELIDSLVKTKNSKIELNNKQPIQSLIFVNNSQKLTEQNPFASSKQMDQLETEFRNIFLNLEHKKQMINPLQLVISQNIDVDNMELLFYVLSDQMKRANRQFFKSLQPDELFMFSFQGQFTADSKDTQAYALVLQETQNLTYNEIASNESYRQNFINQFTKGLAIDLKIQPNQIQMVAMEKGSIKIIFEVITPSGHAHSSEDFQELQRLYPGTSPQLQLHDYFKIAALSVNDFDEQYDMTWNNFSFGNHGVRGPKGKTQPYFYPVGWKGFGLKVSKKYGNNDNWLMMNQNMEEWYVMYHGTKFKAVKQIVQNGFQVGPLQAYENQICKLTNQKIGKGVYFSNHVEVCDGYAEPTKIGNESFRLAFQSRVKPEALRQCPKTSNLIQLISDFKKNNKSYDPSLNNMELWNDDYFVINNTRDIRPYRILLKKLPRRQ